MGCVTPLPSRLRLGTGKPQEGEGEFSTPTCLPARPELCCSAVASFSRPIVLGGEPNKLRGSQHNAWHNRLSSVVPSFLIIILL